MRLVNLGKSFLFITWYAAQMVKGISDELQTSRINIRISYKS